MQKLASVWLVMLHNRRSRGVKLWIGRIALMMGSPFSKGTGLGGRLIAGALGEE